MDQETKKDSWVATVLVRSTSNHSDDGRLKALFEIVLSVEARTKGDGVILFPGGWFDAGQQGAKNRYKWVERKVGEILNKTNRDIIVVLGIDGRVGQYPGDQIAVAVSRKGIEAIGRKFHAARSEKNYIELARDHLCEEEGKSRIFGLGQKKYFLCACYDSFGVKQKKIPNFGIDVILDLVHRFSPKGKGSGHQYFAKHGFAGASQQWNCLVFGAAVFVDREIPINWPSGVYWNQGNKSTRKWKYRDNPVKPETEFTLSIEEGSAAVRIFRPEAAQKATSAPTKLDMD